MNRASASEGEKHLQNLGIPLFCRRFNSAPGADRTRGLRFRKPLLYPLSYEGGGWCEMWCEIRRHTSRHLYRGYWSALRVERLRRNRCDAGETGPHLVFGHAEATASVITSVVWGFGRVVSIHRSSETRLPQFGNATPTVR